MPSTIYVLYSFNLIFKTVGCRTCFKPEWAYFCHMQNLKRKSTVICFGYNYIRLASHSCRTCLANVSVVFATQVQMCYNSGSNLLNKTYIKFCNSLPFDAHRNAVRTVAAEQPTKCPVIFQVVINVSVYIKQKTLGIIIRLFLSKVDRKLFSSDSVMYETVAECVITIIFLDSVSTNPIFIIIQHRAV